MNVSTTYLGLKLRNPLIVGSSPFCDDVHQALRLQDAGAAALVMRSLFAEQIDPPPGAGAWRNANSFRPEPDYPEVADYQLSPAQYVEQVRHLKRVLTIPVIASINCAGSGRWVEFARQLEEAGADAIELNFYRVVTDGRRAGDEIEGDLLRVVGELAGAVKLPIAVKLSPFHTSVAQIVPALELEGAAGVVLFNRFYQPDIDIDEIEVRPQIRLSDPGERLLRLRWLAILSPEMRGSLAASGGIHGGAGVIKAVLAGAHAVQLVSVLIKQGPHMLSVMLDDLRAWMTRHGCVDLAAFRGRLNLARCSDPSAYERANYIRTLDSLKL
jgi:dihydroorotate dehydrogenase (fumarate)